MLRMHLSRISQNQCLYLYIIDHFESQIVRGSVRLVSTLIFHHYSQYVSIQNYVYTISHFNIPNKVSYQLKHFPIKVQLSLAKGPLVMMSSCLENIAATILNLCLILTFLFRCSHSHSLIYQLCNAAVNFCRRQVTREEVGGTQLYCHVPIAHMCLLQPVTSKQHLIPSNVTGSVN